jgi:hypothetical protein
MTGEPVRDPFADHLLTPHNCALIIIDYQPVQVSSIRSMDREGPAGRPARAATSPWKPTAPPGTRRHLSDPAIAAIAADAGPDASPGPAPLGRAARHPGDHQVDPPGPDRGEPADLRLRVAGRGHAAAGCLGPDRRHQ